MKTRYKNLVNILFPIIIFLFSFILRQYFFTGFILGDDSSEFSAAQYIIANGPNLHDAFHLRFGAWIFNIISFKLFGISEFSFFLPTFLMSASLGIIGYYILVSWKYTRGQAFLAGLFIASAPFEILIGVVRANDLIFSWLLALAFLFFIHFEKKPVIQGIFVGFILWFAFYVKLWVVYLFPALIVYYFAQGMGKKKWYGLISFLITSLVFHGVSSIIWKISMGSFFPFIHYHPATYPVPQNQLANMFQVYPKMIFFGSEFGTTLFGYIPYLLILMLLSKVILSRNKKFSRLIRFDKLDLYLFAFYTSFLLFLNFFPTTFKFDQFYSASRIFRYLAPISFPITLHFAKIVIDFATIFFKSDKLLKLGIVFILLVCANFYQANEATKPGQIYRQALLSVVKDIKEQSPPQILLESWLKFFMQEIYLKELKYGIVTVPNYTFDDAKDYEMWLKEIEPTLPNGTILITGLSNFVYYGCYNCGFRIKQFRNDLDSNWELFREYNMLSYLPVPEPARLWIWIRQK